MKGPHICDCLCALCERLGAGAFGPQPDGSPGVVVIRRRRGRRDRPHSRAMKASPRSRGCAPALRSLGKGGGPAVDVELSALIKVAFKDNQRGPGPLAGPRGGSR